MKAQISLCFVLAFGSAAMGARLAAPPQEKGLAVAYPWTFDGGTKTSHETAMRTADEVLRKAGFSTVGIDVANNAWRDAGLGEKRFRDLPSDQEMEKFGQRLHASVVLFGRASWNTRSIWVDLGPKTISTADVDVYVFNVASGRVMYKKEGVHGRSDEKENGWKVAADVLITPVVTAVSGGPATPREQKAVQIALARALHPWVHGERG